MSDLKWGIEITVPAKAKGKSKEVLYSDRSGTRIFQSRALATDFKNGADIPQIDVVEPKPHVVRVKVTVSKVKPA